VIPARLVDSAAFAVVESAGTASNMDPIRPSSSREPAMNLIMLTARRKPLVMEAFACATVARGKPSPRT
jgi:hypothetical protein